MEEYYFDEEIKKIAEKIRRDYKPLKIILFGSSAEGRAGKDSDIDMLIIKDTKESYRERWMNVCRLVRDFKRRIPFEPIVLTPEELDKRLNMKDTFMKSILEKGKVLYGRE
jgi:predicted nucleotidyltransferase